MSQPLDLGKIKLMGRTLTVWLVNGRRQLSVPEYYELVEFLDATKLPMPSGESVIFLTLTPDHAEIVKYYRPDLK